MERKVIRWKPILLLLAVLVVAFCVIMAQARERLNALQLQSEQLQQTYAALDQENRELNQTLKYVATDVYVEEVARSEYGYVREGEIRFRFNSLDDLKGYTAEELLALMEELRY